MNDEDKALYLVILVRHSKSLIKFYKAFRAVKKLPEGAMRDCLAEKLFYYANYTVDLEKSIFLQFALQ